MHVTYMMLCTVAATGMEQFTVFDVLSLLIASYCHDVGHPGNTNDYEIKAITDLAITHNDDSVLERHHAHMTWEILRREEYNADFLSGALSPDELRQIRRTVIEGILATDMRGHTDMLQALDRHHIACAHAADQEARDGGGVALASRKDRYLTAAHGGGGAQGSLAVAGGSGGAGGGNGADGVGSSPPPSVRGHFNMTKPADRQLILNAILHAADLSGQVLPHAVAMQWGDRCLDEFQAQAEREEREGLMPAPFMLGLSQEDVRLRGQIIFVERSVKPLWSLVADCFPEMIGRVREADANIKAYKARLDVLRREQEEGKGTSGASGTNGVKAANGAKGANGANGTGKEKKKKPPRASFRTREQTMPETGKSHPTLTEGSELIRPAVEGRRRSFSLREKGKEGKGGDAAAGSPATVHYSGRSPLVKRNNLKILTAGASHRAHVFASKRSDSFGMESPGSMNSSTGEGRSPRSDPTCDGDAGAAFSPLLLASTQHQRPRGLMSRSQSLDVGAATPTSAQAHTRTSQELLERSFGTPNNVEARHVEAAGGEAGADGDSLRRQRCEENGQENAGSGSFDTAVSAFESVEGKE